MILLLIISNCNFCFTYYLLIQFSKFYDDIEHSCLKISRILRIKNYMNMKRYCEEITS